MLRNLTYLVLLFCSVLCVSCTRGNRNPDADVPSQQDQSQAGPGAENGQPSPPGMTWTEEYERMTAVLELSDQEKAKLKTAFEARAEAIARWRAENDAQLAQFEQEMKRAAKARDLAGLRQAKSKAEPLRNELRELSQSHQAIARQETGTGTLLMRD